MTGRGPPWAPLSEAQQEGATDKSEEDKGVPRRQTDLVRGETSAAHAPAAPASMDTGACVGGRGMAHSLLS